MSNANRIKINLEWRREDGKTYIKVPINKGKEGRPFFILQRLLEICFLKAWVTPLQLLSYLWTRDGKKIKDDLDRVEELQELRRVQNR